MRIKPSKYKICVVLALVFVFFGCGVKNNPIPRTSMIDYRPMVDKIEAVSKDDAVVLSWELNDEDALIKNIYIERSEQGAAGNECPECPQKFERIGHLEISKPLLGKQKTKKQGFVDTKVEKGKIYNYRLMLCDIAGVCQDKPATQVNFK